MITPRDEAQIAFYFRAQDRFERSPAGPMLERASLLGIDSEGERVDRAEDDWNWLPPDETYDSAGCLSERYGSDSQRQVHELRHAGGYEPDHAVLIAWAEAGRRMLAVERASPRAKMALEAYYGDRGDGWAARGAGYVSGPDPETRAATTTPAFGPGRIAALFALTDDGQAFIQKERARLTRGGGSEHRTDDEVLITVLAVHSIQPNPTRRVRLMKIQDAAESLLRGAWQVWTQTMPERRRGAA